MPPLIILAGGKGTRLASVVEDRPKVLALIEGKPFLDYLLSWLESYGIRDVMMSLGVMSEQVVEYISNRIVGPTNLSYCVEDQPLGTAGGVAHCLLHYLKGDELLSEVLIVNGDSWLSADVNALVKNARKSKENITLCAVSVEDCGRYGSLEIEGDKLKAFNEKDINNAGIPGWINAGIYYLKGRAIEELKNHKEGSIERDFFAQQPKGAINVFKSDCDFIDIGTPESYRRAGEIIRMME